MGLRHLREHVAAQRSGEEDVRRPRRSILSELIAFTNGEPDFLALTDRMLLPATRSIPVAFVVFDVLSLDGGYTMTKPYWQRREILETGCSMVAGASS